MSLLTSSYLLQYWWMVFNCFSRSWVLTWLVPYIYLPKLCWKSVAKPNTECKSDYFGFLKALGGFFSGFFFFFFILKLFGVIFLDNFIPQGHLNPIYYVQVALLQRFVNITQEICIYIFFHNSSLQGRIWLRKKQKSSTYRTFQCFLTWKETEMQEEEDIAWDG